MQFTTIIQKSDFGYSISVPTLPGCHSQGDTEEEALLNIQDAIRTYLEMEQVELNKTQARLIEVTV